MSEETKNNNIGLKVALGIAIALIIGVGAYTFNLYNDSKANEAELVEQRETVLGDLKNTQAQLEVAINEKGELSSDLQAEKERVDQLIADLEQAELNIKNLRGYQSKYNSLKKQVAIVMKENDRLKVENKTLAVSLDSTKVDLEQRKMMNDSLTMQNDALADVVESATVLNTAKLKGEGVIVRSSGKIIENEKARRVDKLRFCFTVTKNSLVAPGEKAFFVQVIDPKNNILGANEAVVFDDMSLNYTLISTFNYEVKDLDICEYVDKANKKEDFAEGMYKVNIFDQNRLVSSTTFTLE